MLPFFTFIAGLCQSPSKCRGPGLNQWQIGDITHKHFPFLVTHSFMTYAMCRM